MSRMSSEKFESTNTRSIVSFLRLARIILLISAVVYTIQYIEWFSSHWHFDGSRAIVEGALGAALSFVVGFEILDSIESFRSHTVLQPDFLTFGSLGASVYIECFAMLIPHSHFLLPFVHFILFLACLSAEVSLHLKAYLKTNRKTPVLIQNPHPLKLIDIISEEKREG